MSLSDLPLHPNFSRPNLNVLDSKTFSSHDEGLEWATGAISEDLLNEVFTDICGGAYVPEKTTNFLDTVLNKAKELPEVKEKQTEGYKWPKLSINIMKRAASWYKSKKDVN